MITGAPDKPERVAVSSSSFGSWSTSTSGSVAILARFHIGNCASVGSENGYPTTKASSATSDRKSTRLNSSHTVISYAVFCLKKKKKLIKHTSCTKHDVRVF